MTVQKGSYGQWIVSDWVDGFCVHKQYYGYTKKESVKLFKEWIKTL